MSWFSANLDFNDSASMVSESYLSDHHVHRPQKRLHLGLSEFQNKLIEFTNSITKLGTIRKLVNITNGFWLTPLECAEEAVNEAGSAEFPFCVQYRTLACADDNDIELVTDQSLLPLQWQPAAHILTILNDCVVRAQVIHFHSQKQTIFVVEGYKNGVSKGGEVHNDVRNGLLQSEVVTFLSTCKIFEDSSQEMFLSRINKPTCFFH